MYILIIVVWTRMDPIRQIIKEDEYELIFFPLSTIQSDGMRIRPRWKNLINREDWERFLSSGERYHDISFIDDAIENNDESLGLVSKIVKMALISHVDTDTLEWYLLS